MKEMHMVECKDRSDAFEQVCRKKGSNPHHIKHFIRKRTWFKESFWMLLRNFVCHRLKRWKFLNNLN
ncbi:hypothetical protein X975_17166, partial [Stegodyphus mimosarum]